jgi:hypothetical protein
VRGARQASTPEATKGQGVHWIERLRARASMSETGAL